MMSHSLPSQPSRAGQRLATLRLLRRIGEGGMGSVYAAVDESSGAQRAVKILHPELARSLSVCRRFWREAEIAATLTGEAFVPVTGFDVAQDGTPYIVMELLEGSDLGAIFARETRIPTARLLNLVGQACRGLRIAHEHSPPIVHRDLKPENLFVCQRQDGKELLKILDFGIAKFLESTPAAPATRTGNALGTPHYMSPEQARGARTIDSRTDVYALGVILYEGLSGTKPHPGESYNEILSHILTQEPIALAELRLDLPSGLAALVHRAMSYDVSRRVASVTELAEQLERFEVRSAALARPAADLRCASPVQRASEPTVDPSLADTQLSELSGVIPASAPGGAVASQRAVTAGNEWIRLLKYAAAGSLIGLIFSVRPWTWTSRTAAGAASVSATPLPAPGESTRELAAVIPATRVSEPRPSPPSPSAPTRVATSRRPEVRKTSTPAPVTPAPSEPGSDLRPPASPAAIDELLPP
jgi:eukaryotic-like serine/threonine-protein kinase